MAAYKMVTPEEISSIKVKKSVKDIFSVERIDNELFKLIGFNYGEKETKLVSNASEVASFINEYLGLTK